MTALAFLSGVLFGGSFVWLFCTSGSEAPRPLPPEPKPEPVRAVLPPPIRWLDEPREWN